MSKLFVNFARAFVLANSVAFGSQSVASTFKISNTGLWRVKNIESGSITSRLFKEAEAILIPGTEGSSKEIVIVERRPYQTNGKDRAIDFRSIVVGPNKDSKRLIVQERAYTQDRQPRYVVEYMSTDGSEFPIRTIVLAVRVGQELFTFTYENAEPIYKQNVDSVRLLMKSIAIKNSI